MKDQFVQVAKANPFIQAYFLADGLEQPGSGYHVKVASGFAGIQSLTLVDTNQKPPKNECVMVVSRPVV